jgi:hypothetical protein
MRLPVFVDQRYAGILCFSLNPAEREQWNRVSRKRGRPKLGQGFKRVSVSLEQGLLNRVTAFAKKRRLSRSMFVATVLEQALAREERSAGEEEKRAV